MIERFFRDLTKPDPARSLPDLEQLITASATTSTPQQKSKALYLDAKANESWKRSLALRLP